MMGMFRKEIEASIRFELMNGSFADCSLEPLGYDAL